MALEVEYITLGDASKRLEVPSPTLRHWTTQLEELNIHFVKRNGRSERIYEDSDIEVFSYVQRMKEEYGRRVQMVDLAQLVKEKGAKGELELRSNLEAPIPQASPKQLDLLNQEDIKQLMSSDRVKQFMEIIVGETMTQMREEIKAEMKEEVRKEIREEMEKASKVVIDSNQLVVESIESNKEEINGVEANISQKLESTKVEIQSSIDERDKKMDEFIKEYREDRAKSSLPWWKKMFGYTEESTPSVEKQEIEKSDEEQKRVGE